MTRTTWIWIRFTSRRRSTPSWRRHSPPCRRGRGSALRRADQTEGRARILRGSSWFPAAAAEGSPSEEVGAVGVVAAELAAAGHVEALAVEGLGGGSRRFGMYR